MFTSLIIAGLIIAIILYGIFFLIFKLIWILFKNKRNFWPLVLAGVATLLIALLTVLATYRVYQVYAKPFSPIVTAAAQTKQPIYGTRPYTDARYGFSLTLHDGMTLSDWIQITPQNQTSALVGADVNMFTNKTRDVDNIAGILILHQTQSTPKDTAPRTATQLMNHAITQINQGSFPGRVEISTPPQEINVGTDATGAYVTGKIFSENVPQPLEGSLLIATRGTSCFFIIGIGADAAQQTAYSFHF